jgi:hypothetical protein
MKIYGGISLTKLLKFGEIENNVPCYCDIYALLGAETLDVLKNKMPINFHALYLEKNKLVACSATQQGMNDNRMMKKWLRVRNKSDKENDSDEVICQVCVPHK